MRLRNPVVDLRRVLNAHMVAGGPSADSGRLDYLVRWAEATGDRAPRRLRRDRRVAADARGAPVERALGRHPRRAAGTASRSRDVPPARRGGARLQDRHPRARHRRARSAGGLGAAGRASRARSRRAGGLGPPARARGLRPRAVLAHVPAVAQRAGGACSTPTAPATRSSARSPTSRSPTISRRMPGTREVAVATVASTVPLRLEIASRRFVDGMTIVALHINRQALAEHPLTTLKIQKTSFKFGRMPLGQIHTRRGRHPRLGAAGRPTAAGRRSPDRRGRHVVRPRVHLRPRDRRQPSQPRQPGGAEADLHPVLVRAVARTSTSGVAARTRSVEAEWADELADRRARGELNPEVWPPLVDEDRFDVLADDAAAPDAGRHHARPRRPDAR